MSCRKISKIVEHIDLVKKSVEIPKEFDAIMFPDIDVVQYDSSSLDAAFRIFPNLPYAVKQAIIQQYNEIFIYWDARGDRRKILAPQVTVSFDKHNLPIIWYPYFEPLVNEDKVWSNRNHICMMYVGARAKELGISIEEMRDFYAKVDDLCEYYDLVEDDIIKNPSNIGYSSLFGIRLIDYGLAEDDILVTSE